MINIPVKIELPEIWQGTFEKNKWSPINFIVGANSTGKSLFSEQLKQQLQSIVNRHTQPNSQLRVRLLTAERLAGFEKQQYNFFQVAV
jgi:predicted AAA+ superfamily ATPase